MISNSDSNIPRKEVPSDEISRPLTRWIVALCILTAGTFAFSEVASGWFGSYVHFIAGSELVWWGFITLIGSIVGAIFYLIWSTVSDNLRTRFGRRIPLILVGGLATAGLTILFIESSNIIWLLIDGGIFIAITRNMLSPARSLVPDLIPQDKRGRVNTLLTIMTNVGSIMIWIPALILLPGGGKNYPRETHVTFITTGAIILALTCIIVTLLVREPPIAEPPRHWIQDLKKVLDWHEMAKNKDFLKIFVANLFLQAADSAIFNYLLPFIESINFDLMIVIIAGPIVGVCLGLGLYFLGKSTDKIGRKFVTIVGFVFAPVGAWIIALSRNNIWLLIVGFGVFFSFYLGGVTAVESWVQDILPKDKRGRFFGLINITSAIGVGLGAVLSGFLADHFGIFWIFAASALILWASIPFFLCVPETLKRKNTKSSSKGTPALS